MMTRSSAHCQGRARMNQVGKSPDVEVRPNVDVDQGNTIEIMDLIHVNDEYTGID